MKICIAGYRPSKLPGRYGYNIYSTAYRELGFAIQDVLQIELLRNQATKVECISGMALGVDQLYVVTADRIKHNHPICKVLITAAVPCRGQELKWPV